MGHRKVVKGGVQRQVFGSKKGVLEVMIMTLPKI